MSRGDRRFCSICQQAEDRSLGHEPKTWGYQGSVGKSGRYQRPTEVVGFSAGLSDSKGIPASPTAQVSTTRMRGIGLGLGGLDILTLPRFSVLARVCVLKFP